MPTWRTAILKRSARVSLAVVVGVLITLGVSPPARAQLTEEGTPESLGISICSKPSVPRTVNPVRDVLTG